MKFSVTIPAYKSRYFLDAIKSIVSQTYSDWELIIVDDCSPEDLYTIVEPFLKDKRIHYYHNEKNCGAINVVDNWNICLNYCTGDYVVCMGDDDRLLSCCLEEYKKLIEQNPGLNVYHTRTEIIDEDGKVVNLQESRPEWESALSLIWNRWNHRNKQFIGDFCYRTDYLKQAGGYHKLPLAWGSDDITAVLAAKDKGIANMQTFGFQYRENTQTITQSSNYAKIKLIALRKNQEWFNGFLRNLAQATLSPSDSKYLATIEAQRYKYFYDAIAPECIDYIHGKPWRLWWCMHHLAGFHYPVTTFIKWYIKSLWS